MAKRSLKERRSGVGAHPRLRFLEFHFTSAISAGDPERTNKEWMETNRWLDSRIAGEKGVSRGRKSFGAQAVRSQYGEERNVLNQWTRKRKKKERSGAGRGEDGRARRTRIRRWRTAAEGRRRGRRGRKAGLSRVVSLTSARLIIIINSNLGISPPEGTSRLHWEGRAHGGEASVVKAGCS